MRLLVVVAVLISSGLSYADEFSGWRYTPPGGYTVAASGDHVVLQKVTGKTFCQLALFAPRAPGDTADNEIAFEWKNVVEKNFTASDVKKRVAVKTRSLAYLPTTATVKDGSGNAFAVTHYVVMPAGAVSSVLLTSTNAASRTKCEIAAKTFVGGLVLVTPPPATATATATTATTTTAAPAGTVVGRWATSLADSNPDGASFGAARREYTFAADGTYRFYSEQWGGTYRNDEYRIVDESGTFTVDGDKLTIAPKTATQTLRTGTTKKSSKLALEKATYAWKRHYFEGIKEWNLVLAIGKKTARDGEFASNDRFPSSYLYSEQYKPQWKFPPP